MPTQVTGVYADIYAWQNLYTAYLRAAHGKRSQEAVARFALLKREAYPAQAVSLIYDAARAAGLAHQCPELDPGRPVSLPQTEGLEETLALGLADAVRRAYPELAPGVWLARAQATDTTRLAGLLLVVLWMLPVAAGGARGAARRMLAAWIGACGAVKPAFTCPWSSTRRARVPPVPTSIPIQNMFQILNSRIRLFGRSLPV